MSLNKNKMTKNNIVFKTKKACEEKRKKHEKSLAKINDGNSLVYRHCCR
jgi:hypothetical protein